MKELEKLKMDDEYIIQNDIVKRYLHNKLTPEETVEFEEYMLNKPELLEQLELDSVMQEHLPTALKDVKNATHNSNEGWRLALWNVLSNKTLVHSAFSFAIGVTVVLLINANQTSTPPYSGTIDLVEVSPLRSSSTQDTPDATYSLSNKADHLVLLIQPDNVESESALVTITNTSDSAEIFSKNVMINNTGDIVVHLAKEDLVLGMLEAKLSTEHGRLKSKPLLILVTE